MRVESVPSMAGRTLILGLGNPWRRDDGAGREVARRLEGRIAGKAEVRVAAGEAAEILAAWEGFDAVILVDAAAGPRAGRVHRLDALAAPLPAGLGGLSSHGPGAAEAVELARALGRLPGRLVVYAVEGRDFGLGEGLTPAVERGVEEVVERVLGEVGGA